MATYDCRIDKKNYTLDIPFARQFVVELGGDPEPIQDNWCWEDFGRAYPELAPAAMAWFAEVGDAWSAYRIAQYCGGDVGQAMAVAEKAKDVWVAYELAQNCGADVGWAMGVAEEAEDAWVACRLARDRGADVGRAIWVAYRLARDRGADVDRAMRIAEKAGNAEVISYLQALREARDE